MKKIIPFLFFMLSFTGCRLPEYNWSYFAPQMYYENISSEWVLTFPSQNEWTMYDKDYKPEFFPKNELANLGKARANILYAEYIIKDSTKLVLFINFVSAYHVIKHVRGQEVNFGYYKDRCINNKKNMVTVSLNNTDIEFNNCSVYFEIDGLSHTGIQVILSRQPYSEEVISNCLNYKLGTEEALHRWQPVKNPIREISFLTFNYFFELSCSDMHNAVFVIDGFTYKGEKVPPLRFRLKYFNPEEVPEYVGDGSEVRRLLGS